jgi:hypothetical protein
MHNGRRYDSILELAATVPLRSSVHLSVYSDHCDTLARCVHA